MSAIYMIWVPDSQTPTEQESAQHLLEERWVVTIS
jgi:hypothetical protein